MTRLSRLQCLQGLSDSTQACQMMWFWSLCRGIGVRNKGGKEGGLYHFKIIS